MRNTITCDMPLLIVGAGIGGLSAALSLTRAGFPVHVLEQASELKEIGAGIQLGPNVFRMFDHLGIKDAVAKYSVFPDRYQIMDAVTGEELTHMPLGDLCLKRFGYPYAVAHRHDVHQALVDAVREAKVQITLNCRVVEFSDNGKSVIATSEDGLVIRGSALIGADGIHSRIRETIKKGEPDPLSPGLMAARAVPDIDAVPEEVRLHRITIWLGPKCHTIYYPLRSGTILNLACVFEVDHSRDMSDWNMQNELHKTYMGQHPTILKLLPLLEDRRYLAGTERIAMKEWSRGRVTLLGDAAHVMTQNMAQGGTMAVEDAVVLTDKLLNIDDIGAAFIAYQNERYLRTARVQLAARFYGEVMHMIGAERDLRNAIFKTLDPRENLEAFTWLYEGLSVSDKAAHAFGNQMSIPSSA
jgi:2-polyprenyl-6-methoxyphenol hydroxylase-like FAD-dependent oxidoreductase